MVDSKLLKTVHFYETEQWNVKYFFTTEIASRFPKSSIGKHIVHITKKTKPFEEPDREFKILGISNEKGMFDAYTEVGRNIKQPYIHVEDGYLAYNPYRVNVGSIGIKTAELSHEYISPAYVVFKCKDTILPEYLYLILKSSVFNSIIRENTTGSVRQTLSYDNLSKIKIPVPSIKTQKLLLSEHHATLVEATKTYDNGTDLERSINDTICDLLGITLPTTFENNNYGLYFVNHSKCDKWSVDYLINKNSCDFIETTEYPVVPAKQFIRECQYGLSEKAYKEKVGLPVLRMNNIQNSSVDIMDLKYLPDDTKAIDKYVLNKGDLLFNRTNSKELVGKTAVFSLQGKYVFASYLIRVVIDSKIADVNYVNYLFATKIIRSQINLLSRQILGQANINVDELKSLRFPLPPLKVQREIVAIIDSIKKKANNCMKESLELKRYANKRFEGAIFGET